MSCCPDCRPASTTPTAFSDVEIDSSVIRNSTIEGSSVTGLPDPSAASDAATKEYVDSFRVSTVAALKALSVSGTVPAGVEVLGYYDEADGGGGLFYYDSTSAATDNGGTVIAPTVGSGRWLRVIETDGVSLKAFGAKGDGTADDTAVLQAALNAGVKIRVLPGSSYHKITARVTAPANTHIILEAASELRWTATTANGSTLIGVATRPGIEVIGDNFTLEGPGKLTGPSAGSYVTNEIGIFVRGTDTSLRRSGFRVFGAEITGWGSIGIGGQFVNDVSILRNTIYSCGYAGVMLLSATHGAIQENKVHTITPGTAFNAYGISLTHDSTAYSSDPYAASNGRLAANPFCIDFDVSYNEVYDIPIWTGLDGHGAYEVRFHHNSVYNCYLAVALGNSSGAAANYAGENNSIEYNTITTKRRDGTASTITDTDPVGIAANGGSVVAHRNVRIVGNVLDGFGGLVSHSITFARVKQAVVSNNVIRNWRANGFYTFSSDGVMEGNVFGAVSNTSGTRCIYFDNPVDPWQVIGNKHFPDGGTAAPEGVRYNPSNTVRIDLVGNNFDAATTPYVNLAYLTRGQSDLVPTVRVTNAPTTVSIADCGTAPAVRIEFNPSGSCNIADITGVRIGQKLHIINMGSNTVSFTRPGRYRLDGGADAVLADYDVLELVVIDADGATVNKFAETSRSINS